MLLDRDAGGTEYRLKTLLAVSERLQDDAIGINESTAVLGRNRKAQMMEDGK